MAAAAIFLTGPMAVGKTTTASALQRLLPDPWLRWAADAMQPKADRDLLTNDDAKNRDAANRMLRANLGGARSYVDQGWPLIAELILLDDYRDTFMSVWEGISVHVVVLTAHRDVIVKRVKRDGRTHPSHLATYERNTANAPSWASLTVPTDDRPPEDVASEIIAGLALSAPEGGATSR